MSAKKLGRPTTDPKNHRIAARIDDKTKEILDEYCQQENVTLMEAVRRGVRKLEDDLKK